MCLRGLACWTSLLQGYLIIWVETTQSLVVLVLAAAAAFSCTQDKTRFCSHCLSSANDNPSETQWGLSAPSELACLTVVLSPSILLIFRVMVYLETFWRKIKVFLVPFKVLQCLCHICTTRHLADITKDLCPAGEVAGAKEYMALDVCQWVP